MTSSHFFASKDPRGPKDPKKQFSRFRARLKISSEPPTAAYSCGVIETSRLKFSSLKIKHFEIEIEHFERDCQFFDRWALWDVWGGSAFGVFPDLLQIWFLEAPSKKSICALSVPCKVRSVADFEVMFKDCCTGLRCSWPCYPLKKGNWPGSGNAKGNQRRGQTHARARAHTILSSVGHLRCEGGCGAEVWKLPQWLLPLAVAGNFFKKRDAEIGHLPGGFKCEFGGGNRVRKKSISMRKFKLRELNAENCVN